MFSLTTFIDGLPLLFRAASMTLEVSAAGLVLGFFIGLVICCGRLAPQAAIRAAAGAYVRVFRGVPLLVQLLLVYYVLPFVGLNVSPVTAAVSAVSLCSASYIAEILRGGFVNLPRGQIEAATMLGLSAKDRLWRIQVPQAVRMTLPSLVNEMVLLIKASSLISVVGVAEITRTAQNIAASTYQPLEAYVAAGMIYFLLCGALALIAHGAERRLRAA
ncbi:MULTISPECIES: amino acid ABC transporter permease [unclassified Burkholderia]|uniref:amino acid ABC transporter permease n=1 Tax=unclassified Burkholderia TaxID=2613784 RepID=UPI000F585E3B|nr:MULTISPECIES: amino acid ABC transporter permease [unclassified Burkholderia]RQR46743.1 amino acid ABC transporter permease [Burkholderia sp. Bp9131]RQR79629.1 amino acid ABC transporter permease [Burkholderia sp. Bp9015]RQR90247.1 amino acid ABC transporter permease [Burkholderia sp. Bp9011]RQR99255.1 amino acid ABC transporter permease [Burkholderia sp. Bp9010]RQS01946.1 amino acid ABC transporter permease [Burkholderia sp. Bp8994]